MLRVGIVDDHILFRKSLSLLINSFHEMIVVIEAQNGKDFLIELKDTPVDVVLLDLQMPIMDGFDTCDIIAKNYPEIKILIVSQLTNRESIDKIIEYGAHGYFTKNSNPEQLELAIRNTTEHGFYFGAELGKVIKDALLYREKVLPELEEKPNAILTDRECEILKMICHEMSSREISEKLHLNVRTVDTHRKNILLKTNSKNFIGALLFAFKHGIISISDF